MSFVTDVTDLVSKIASKIAGAGGITNIGKGAGDAVGKISGGAYDLAMAPAKIPNDFFQRSMGKGNSGKGFNQADISKEFENAAIKLGVVGEESKTLRENLRSAYEDAVLFDKTYTEVAETFNNINETLKVQTQLTEHGLNRFLALDKIGALDPYNMLTAIESFNTLGVSIDDTADKVEDMRQKATKSGLNIKAYIETVVKNIDKVNKFGFKNGIDGLEKMAKLTQKLRLDFGFIDGFAEKLFDPQSAIEAAAGLQLLGGGFSALADPFTLMYQATNDMEGLTQSIVKAASASVTFNKQTNQFQISKTEMRRLREVAKETGISYDDLSKSALNFAKSQKALSELSANVNFNKLSEEDKDKITTLSQMKDGEFKVKVGQDKDNKDIFTKLSDLSEEQIKDLKKQEIVAPEDIAKNTLTATESINGFVESIDSKIKGRIADAINPKLVKGVQMYGEVIEPIAKEIKDQEKIIIQNIQKGLNVDWLKAGSSLFDGFVAAGNNFGILWDKVKDNTVNVGKSVIGVQPDGKKEEGDPVQKSKSYVVGEKGPELFTPTHNGFVTTNNMTQKLLDRMQVLEKNINNTTTNNIVSENKQNKMDVNIKGNITLNGQNFNVENLSYIEKTKLLSFIFTNGQPNEVVTA